MSRSTRCRCFAARWKRSSEYEAQKRYVKAISKGIMKVMAKMGICTFQSYCGAQIFDAVGLTSAFLDKYFTGTASPIEGVGLAEIAEETVRRHKIAYGDALERLRGSEAKRRYPAVLRGRFSTDRTRNWAH